MKHKILKKIVIVAVIAALVAAFEISHLGDYLTLSYLKGSQRRFEAIYSGHGFAVTAAYIAIYILVTSLSLPGAAIMTLAGGALFGLVKGTVIVSFASSIGATFACAVSRFLLRDWVSARFGDRLAPINKGIQREGAYYLFTLRLVPVFPFWLINIAMGLTPIPLRTFYWVSQAGMLAGTIVFVNAGKELAKISSLSNILSPGLVLSLVLLGIFPVATKKLLDRFKSKWTGGGSADRKNAN